MQKISLIYFTSPPPPWLPQLASPAGIPTATAIVRNIHFSLPAHLSPHSFTPSQSINEHRPIMLAINLIIYSFSVTLTGDSKEIIYIHIYKYSVDHAACNHTVITPLANYNCTICYLIF